MKRLTVLIVAVALLGGTALLTEHGRATAFSAPNHNCPAVPTLRSFKRGYPILIQTRNVSCAQALTMVQAMESGVGVTLSATPKVRPPSSAGSSTAYLAGRASATAAAFPVTGPAETAQREPPPSSGTTPRLAGAHVHA